MIVSTPMTHRILTLGALLLASATRAEGQREPEIIISHAVTRPARVAPVEHFAGTARVRLLFDTVATHAYAALVSFEAGARTAWHTHPRGQVLVITAGVGRVQRWGGPVEEVGLGDVVWIPAGVKHWHGAAPTTAMTHIAIAEPVNGETVEWLEQVSREQYESRAAGARDAGGTGAQPSAAQRLMGDIAPKLAQLTDSVLFADVWARPELSRRDRSLATVSALIAMNRPDQLRSHMALALRNGVTQEELIEAITHLAFYTGWPSAVTAIGIARQAIDETRR